MNIDFDHWNGAQIADMIKQNLDDKRIMQIMETFKPEFSKDGNQFCFLYGTLPNDCILGFGDTPNLAMLDFAKNFYNQKAILPPK